jgi:hypothetical protein
LKHKTPIQALQKWRAEKPDLFVKRVYEQAGLDTCRVPTVHNLLANNSFFSLPVFNRLHG